MADMVAKGRSHPLGEHTPAARNRAKTSCPKCGGPLVASPHASQAGRRRCPPCTKAAQADYMRKRRARDSA
jgi:hypothetical protein